jgi:hypothetical protein
MQFDASVIALANRSFCRGGKHQETYYRRTVVRFSQGR